MTAIRYSLADKRTKGIILDEVGDLAVSQPEPLARNVVVRLQSHSAPALPHTG